MTYRKLVCLASLAAAVVVIVACGAPENTTPPATNTPQPTNTVTPQPTATETPQPVATPLPEAGTPRVDAHGIEQVYVPAGSFVMGTGDDTAGLQAPAWARRELDWEKPAHEVQLTTGYWIDKTEVSNADFQAFVDDGGYRKQEFWSEAGWQWLSQQDAENLPVACEGEEAADHPRVCVTWYEAEAYARWRGGRLPTEAEWEYAARGPESLIFPWGNEWDSSRANVVDSTGTQPVNSYPEGASWVGALNMAGNAMEWAQDWLGLRYYRENVNIDPQGPETGSLKVEKGGWWGSDPFVARSAYRHFEDRPTYQDHHIGFRIVTPVDGP
ncbi:MAG: SUMF1/EgtB/PvdO family nonheme iron enzyme [Caldilineae bacterium]|nr:SUMF1/EgtB/PvdO family nonheme iron enzyme [Anaerolineae bacterium]MCB9154283.1 SUMF1/EgtB/PvdO family nonheme iron enzyme [Caldilineae bacterium]